MWEVPPLAVLVASVQEPSNPIGKRMRAAYYLRTLFSKEGEEAQLAIIRALSVGLADTGQGSLMRHEFAYIMGQLRDKRFCPTLEEVLMSSSDCVMVRHEAAEALGAIGANRSTKVLNRLLENPDAVPVELIETCQIAIDVMKWRENGGDSDDMPAVCACMLNPYSSVDPAPPHPSHVDKSMSELGEILGNPSLPLFERYRAMFSLRNIGGRDAVQELCRVLVNDHSSALLRHEIAYVLGQLQHPDSVEALEISLRKPLENKMVRHESAEALGAIDSRWDDVEPILLEFSKDDNDVIRESCLVALDAADYWGHGTGRDEDDEEKQAISDPALSTESVASTFARQKAQPILLNHFNVE
ncbi:hypothetical protein ACA910_016912 [Epithemia clementina (nom. ined.)]